MEGVDGMESTRMRQNRFCFVTSSSNRGSDLVGAEEEEEEEGEEEEEEEEGRVKSGRVEEMRDRHNRNDIRRCREKVWSVWKWCGCGVDVDVEVESLWMWMDVGENWCRISLRGTHGGTRDWGMP